MGLWPSTGYELVGYEFKASRSDLKRDLQDLSKENAIGKYCTYWYLCLSDAKLMDGLVIPKEWGVLVVATRGGVRLLKQIKKPTKRKAKAVTPSLFASMVRRATAAWVPRSVHQGVLEKLHRATMPKYAGNEAEELTVEESQRLEILQLQGELKRERASIAGLCEHLGIEVGDRNTYGMRTEARMVELARTLQHSLVVGDGARNAVVQLTAATESFERLAQSAAESAIAIRAVYDVTVHSKVCSTKWSGCRCTCGGEAQSATELALLAKGWPMPPPEPEPVTDTTETPPSSLPPIEELPACNIE